MEFGWIKESQVQIVASVHFIRHIEQLRPVGNTNFHPTTDLRRGGTVGFGRVRGTSVTSDEPSHSDRPFPPVVRLVRSLRRAWTSAVTNPVDGREWA